MDLVDSSSLTTPKSSPHHPQTPALLLEGLQVLIVDDDVDTVDLFSIVLKAQGAEVCGATSSAEAIAIANQHYPDLLISDIRLSDEDGYTLLRKMKLLATTVEKQLSAVAITGLLREEDCSKIVSEGFQTYLSKPTDIDLLIEVVAGLAGRR